MLTFYIKNVYRVSEVNRSSNESFSKVYQANIQLKISSASQAEATFTPLLSIPQALFLVRKLDSK